MKLKNMLIDAWVFTVLIFALAFSGGWCYKAGVSFPIIAIPIITGLLGFLFWAIVCKRPIVEIYSKGYPYRKLKFWGGLLAVVFFEYVLVWGLHTKQIQMADKQLYSITVALAGAIAFYFSFIRMRVSLRYLFLGICVPLFASGSALGLGKYLGFVQFSSAQNISPFVIFFNTSYWILFSMLYQLICDEPAFRGFLMQRLLNIGKVRAIVISSLIYACWQIMISIFTGINRAQAAVSFAENFIVGCLLATLFIQGKNLLIAAASHGIIDGLKISLLAPAKYPGLSQYFTTAGPIAEFKFIMLWFLCLCIGSAAVWLTPQKKLRAVDNRFFTRRRNLTIILLLFFMFANNSAFAEGEGIMGKRIVMIIAKDGFRDEELLEPKAIFERNGVKVTVASSSLGAAKGMLGAKVNAEKTISDIKASDYDAVVFVGGAGASEYWDNPTAHSIARKANEQGRLVAAICIAPVTLARAGLLKGKRATVWASEAGVLKRSGALYTGKGVEADANIITADGPSSAAKFGEAIIEELKTLNSKH